MDERRRKARTDLEAYLNIKTIRGEGEKEVMISVTNVSTSGIGFDCGVQLDKGNVYEGTLTLWTKEVIPIFVEIVRVKEVEEGFYNYGGVFIGMPELIANKIGFYQTVKEHSK
ncbi:MAG: PilZ domain-containing protein [Lachnospiraceae bacterium]|nr:PilZ domain-containing protein [Lachnospiraceae bacterium]